MQTLKISDNHRFITYEDGRPFFYLADTAWELFHRLTPAEARRYLEDRAGKRFTVIQAVALAEMDGLRVPNANGHVPFHDLDPAKPVEEYWRHVDWVIDQAASLGLHVGLLPTWGDKWNNEYGVGPAIFNPVNAHAYGRWIARRYGQKPIIWILGGDRTPVTSEHRDIINEMARGIHEGDGGRNLISFHPRGDEKSSTHFHNAQWLDFNMLQTGHARNSMNYKKVAVDYDLQPTKPVLDAEPGYEDHPAAFQLDNGYLDDYDARKFLYWATFAGACGHTYGAHPIWQFRKNGLEPKSFCRRDWEDAMHFPGSGQMQFGRALLESRPYLTRVPDQSLIKSKVGEGSSHVQATRDADGGYAFIYVPFYGDDVTVDLGKLSGTTISAHWYDPRNGKSEVIGDFARSGDHTFHAPRSGPDWVLVLDDAARRFGPPGETGGRS